MLPGSRARPADTAFSSASPLLELAKPRGKARKAQPVAQTVAALKTVGYGGAALKPAPVADEDGWEEF